MRHRKLSVAALLACFCLLGLMVLLPLAEGPRAEADTDEQVLWSPYWSVEPGYTSTLEMKNNRAVETLTVNVSLYFASGEEYYLEPLQVGPRQTVTVNLNLLYDALPPAVAARATREGTLEVEFDAENHAALMGSVSVRNPERGIAWNFRLYPRDAGLPKLPLRGLFWFAGADSDGFVAVQNVAEESITLNGRLQVNGTSHPLPAVWLASGQGYKLELRSTLAGLELATAAAGGVEFTWEGPPDAIKAHGVLYNNRGFSAEVDFNPAQSWDEPRTLALRTPRFAIGAPDPRLGLPGQQVFEPSLVLHNFSGHDLGVNLSVGFRPAEGPREIQIPVQLPAGASQVLNLR